MGKAKERATAKQLYMTGKNQKDIANLVQVQEKTVSDWVRKYGWKQEREARFIGKRTQEENLRKLIGQMAEKAIRVESEMETARQNNNTDEFLSLQTELNRITDAASKWNKQLEAISKENKVSLITYLHIMDEIFEALRNHNPKLYMDCVDFQEQHLTDISLKLG